MEFKSIPGITTRFEITNDCAISINHRDDGIQRNIFKGEYLCLEQSSSGTGSFQITGEIFLREKGKPGFIKLHAIEGRFERTEKGEISETEGIRTMFSSFPLPGGNFKPGTNWSSPVKESVDVSRWGISDTIALTGWGFYECRKIVGSSIYISGKSSLKYDGEGKAFRLLTPVTILGEKSTEYVFDSSAGELSTYTSKYDYIVSLKNMDLYRFKGSENAVFTINHATAFTDTASLSKRANNIIADNDIGIVVSKESINLNLGEVLFESGRADVSPASLDKLSKVVKFIAGIPEKLVIVVEGHTDNIGNDQYNYLLSKMRARNVRDHLIEKTGTGNKLSYIGYGETKPIASNSTAEGRRKNRRVEIVIKPE